MITAEEAFEISNRVCSDESDIFDDITHAAYQGDCTVVLQWSLATTQIEYFRGLGYSVEYGPLAYQTTISWG